jgi:hypothetical protein
MASSIMIRVIMLSVILVIVVCHYSVFYYADCRKNQKMIITKRNFYT